MFTGQITNNIFKRFMCTGDAEDYSVPKPRMLNLKEKFETCDKQINQINPIERRKNK